MVSKKATAEFKVILIEEGEWSQVGLNPGPLNLKTNALPTELVNLLASASRSVAVMSLYIHTITLVLEIVNSLKTF